MASVTGLSRRDVAKVLDALAAIAYREAEKGFTIPGICRLKVVEKKACRRRNPKTGQYLMVGAHRVLRIVPLKKAKDLVAPRPADLITRLAEPPPKREQAAVPAPPAGPPAEGSGEIQFRCAHCNSVLAADPAQAGTEGACPYCKRAIRVPALETPPAVPKKSPRLARHPVDEFITFVCQTCDQEIEAPTDMLGMEVNCPACGAAIHVTHSKERESAPPSGIQKPKGGVDRSAMTMRIDLSALKD